MQNTPKTNTTDKTKATDSTIYLFLMVIACCVTGFISFFCGAYTGASDATNILQQEAIKHGYAHYDKTTGKWQWYIEKE